MERFRLLQSRDERKNRRGHQGSNDLALKFQQEVWQFLQHSDTLRLARARVPAPFNEPSNNQYRVGIKPPLSIEPVDSEMSTTTSVQAAKGSELFRQQVLYPRYISIRNLHYANFDKLADNIAETVQQKGETLEGLLGDIYKSINVEQATELRDHIARLRINNASEAQWEDRIYREYFLKGKRTAARRPPPNGIPQVIVEVQSTIALDISVVLPPLLAFEGDRKSSMKTIAPETWCPDLAKARGGRTSWIPDYRSAIAIGVLDQSIADEDPKLLSVLPAFRIAFADSMPSFLVIEAKSSPSEQKAATNYVAFLSSWVMHERLLLHWIARTNGREDDSIKINDNLNTFAITLCGSRCTLFRICIRRKSPTNSFEPIRYDVESISDADLDNDAGPEKLCKWINTIFAYGMTQHFESIISDLNAYRDLKKDPEEMEFLATKCFVYKLGGEKDEITMVEQEKATGIPLDLEKKIGDEVCDFIEDRVEVFPARAQTQPAAVLDEESLLEAKNPFSEPNMDRNDDDDDDESPGGKNSLSKNGNKGEATSKKGKAALKKGTAALKKGKAVSKTQDEDEGEDDDRDEDESLGSKKPRSRKRKVLETLVSTPKRVLRPR